MEFLNDATQSIAVKFEKQNKNEKSQDNEISSDQENCKIRSKRKQNMEMFTSGPPSLVRHNIDRIWKLGTQQQKTHTNRTMDAVSWPWTLDSGHCPGRDTQTKLHDKRENENYAVVNT